MLVKGSFFLKCNLIFNKCVCFVSNHFFSQWVSDLLSLGNYNKIPQTGWLKLQNFTSHSFRVLESNTEAPADLVPGESSLPGLWMTAFSLYPPVQGRGSSSLPSSFIKTLIPLCVPHPHDLR